MKSPCNTFALFSITIVLALPMILPSCTHDHVTLEGVDTVCYKQVESELQSSCGKQNKSCHYKGSNAEAFDPTDYTSIMNSVTAYDPRGSALYEVITRRSGENMMPPGEPLSKDVRTMIQVWIAQGAKNNTTCKVP
jgi:hypothetical protein